jgi:tRNA G10  N-methylase Trm11
MPKNNFIYSFNYDGNENELCKLESRHIFKAEEKDKFLFSDLKIDPSSSAFIKKRLDIISSSDDYLTLIQQVKNEKICIERFKVEYLVLHGDTTEYAERLKKLRDIGFSIEGEADYYSPTTIYALCYYNGIWYFGALIKNNFDWHKHKLKPNSFSNSITMSIAKSLINIATKVNKKTTVLDACCGVGTILLEGCFAGHNISGCDINEKTCKYAQENLSFFNYTASLYHSDIKDISKKYDAAIIDLPYNLFTKVIDTTDAHIIESTAKITNRLIIVSTSDITDLINNAGFRVSDYCSVKKKGKKNFSRKIWVCEKIDSNI